MCALFIRWMPLTLPLLPARYQSSLRGAAILDGSLLLAPSPGCYCCFRARRLDQWTGRVTTTTTTTRCTMAQLRKISKKVLSVEQSEGAGARVRRSIGRPELRYGRERSVIGKKKKGGNKKSSSMMRMTQHSIQSNPIQSNPIQSNLSLCCSSPLVGDGFAIAVATRCACRQLDPFLLLDEFRVARPAGFPDHPHRGFETVTYMLKGAFVHEDFMGHYGKIEPGDLQWMTAGKGIVHCEMPASTDESHGLQLWVNLPKADKMCQPGYQVMLWCRGRDWEVDLTGPRKAHGPCC